MKKEAPFSSATLALLLAVAAGLFALAILLDAYDDGVMPPERQYNPGSYSTSALGCAGLYETLKRLGRPVGRSVGRTLEQVGALGVLIVAEPDLSRLDSADGRLLLRAPRLLLVLPKWRAFPDKDRPAWISGVQPRPVEQAWQTLSLVTAQGGILRLEAPHIWTVNEVGFKPTVAGPIQLISSRELRPVVGRAEGMLVGEIIDGDRIIWVLSDPDILANHGLGRGDNAAFAVALLDRLRSWRNTSAHAPLVFDETVHGYVSAEGSPAKLLFEFPFVIVTILLALAGLLLLWSGAGRFGAPIRAGESLDFGKARLIENGARLLDYAGHHREVMLNYVRLTIRQAAQELHAPAGLSEEARQDWLDRLARARGLSGSCGRILAQAERLAGEQNSGLARLFALAGEIHRWKGELKDGKP